MPVDNISSLLTQITEIIDQQNSTKLKEEMNKLHVADAAELIEILSPYYRNELISMLGNHFDSEIIAYLDESVREAIIDLWAQTELSAALSKVDEQDAVEILSELTPESRRSLLRTLKPELRIILEEGLAYPDYSAGRIMQHEFIALPKQWTVNQAIAFLHRANNSTIETNMIYLVDEQRKLVGSVSFAKLLMLGHDSTLEAVADKIVYQAKITDDQEDIFLMFKKYFVDTIPVIDSKDKLVGIILLSNIIDLIYENAQESFLQSAGVTESDFYSNVISTLNARWKWLAVSCLHSLLSAYVTYMFLDVLGKHLILATLNPILAAICGTAGLQTVTVTIRALIGRELIQANTFRAIRKEAIIGLLNGIASAIIISTLLFFIITDVTNIGAISLIFGISIFFGIILATFAGSVIPIFLTRMGIDPAISAGPLLSSFADTIGLLIILNLAKMFL